MADVADYLQTPILGSTKDRLMELRKERGHKNAGETIEFLLNGGTMLSDDAVKVLEDQRDAYGFETIYQALDDLLIKLRDALTEEKKALED